MAVEVHGHESLRAGGDRARHRFRRDVERLRIDVGEDGPRAHGDDGEGGEGRGQGRGHDLVAGAYVEGGEGELDGVGAVAHRDRLGGAHRRRELALERLHFRTEDEPPGVEDAGEGGVDLGADRGEVGPEVDEGDGRRLRFHR